MDRMDPPVQTVEEDDGAPGESVQRAVRVAINGRWWILLTGLVTLVLAVLGLSFVPNVYRSEATILIVEQQIPANLVAPLANATGMQKLQAMTQEVLSRSKLLNIINETRVFGDKPLPPDKAVDLFRRSYEIYPTDVSRDGSFSAFTISFAASTPGMAQEVTRMLATLFIERHSETRVNRANSTTSFLKERLDEKKREAGELEQRIREFRSMHAGSLPESRLSNESRLAELRAQLQSTASNLNRAKQQKLVWESMLSGNVNGQITRLKTERNAMLSRFTTKHPELVKRDEEIAKLELMLANLRSGESLPEVPGRVASIDLGIGQLRGQVEANRLEVENLAQEIVQFEKLVADVQRRLNTAPILEQQLAGLVRESESLNQEIAKLDEMDQKSALSVDMERLQQGEQFRLLEFPALPLKPLSPKRLKISAGAAAAGFVLGFAVAFLLDMWRGCFQTERQIRKKFSIPLVLSIPELHTAQEVRMRKRRAGLEWAGGVLVMAAMLAVEFYVYKYS